MTFTLEHRHITRRKRGNPEGEFQRSLVEALPAILRRGWFFFHVPNNPRNAIHGKQLKDMGMRAGVADLIFIAPKGARCHGLELKDKGRTQSNEQKAFALDLDAAGGAYSVAHDMDEALEALREWGALRISERAA